MNVFVIGDIHGCFHTFRRMVETHWDPDTQVLVQVGDLIDRGKNSPQVVELARKLERDFGERAVFLKGNHDFEMTEHFRRPPNYNWLHQGGEGTLSQYELTGQEIMDDVEWFQNLPLFWENEHLFISHAGISQLADDPFKEDSPYGILWNRSKLKNLGKLQLVGHTPQKEPVYDKQSHAYYIDTGAVYSNYLTGVKISASGEVTDFVKQKTDDRDL